MKTSHFCILKHLHSWGLESCQDDITLIKPTICPKAYSQVWLFWRELFCVLRFQDFFLRLSQTPCPKALTPGPLTSTSFNDTESADQWERWHAKGWRCAITVVVLMNAHAWVPIQGSDSCWTENLLTYLLDTLWYTIWRYWNPYLASSYFLTPVSQGGLLKFLEYIQVGSNILTYLTLTLQISTSYPKSTWACNFLSIEVSCAIYSL